MTVMVGRRVQKLLRPAAAFCCLFTLLGCGSGEPPAPPPRQEAARDAEEGLIVALGTA